MVETCAVAGRAVVCAAVHGCAVAECEGVGDVWADVSAAVPIA